jgi:uncharacterized RDD family membrane protein YckC
MKFELASFFKRFVAYLIDIIPIALVVVVIAMLKFDFGKAFIELSNDAENFSALKTFQMENNILSMICLVIWIIYSIAMDCSAHQGTYGKKLLSIKVVNEKGRQLTFEEAFKRNTSKVISSFIFNLGFFWMLFDPKKQTWHDKIAATYVIEANGAAQNTI